MPLHLDVYLGCILGPPDNSLHTCSLAFRHVVPGYLGSLGTPYPAPGLDFGAARGVMEQIQGGLNHTQW